MGVHVVTKKHVGTVINIGINIFLKRVWNFCVSAENFFTSVCVWFLGRRRGGGKAGRKRREGKEKMEERRRKKKKRLKVRKRNEEDGKYKRKKGRSERKEERKNIYFVSYIIRLQFLILAR